MIQARIREMELALETAPRLFSPRAVDRGTLALLNAADFRCGDRALDLGCGYGVIGIVAARLLGPAQVMLSDNDPEAVAIAARNCRRNGVAEARIVISDGFRNIPYQLFTLILTNPPYHADFSVPKHFIEKGFNRLEMGGRFMLVTKRRIWYEKKLRSIFGGVRIDPCDGYLVMTAEKRSSSYYQLLKESRS